MKRFEFPLFFLFLAIILSCSGSQKPVNKNKSNIINETIYQKTKAAHIIITPSNYSKSIHLGHVIDYKFEQINPQPKLDSIYVYINNKLTDKLYFEKEYIWDTENLKMGNTTVKFSLFYTDTTVQENLFKYTILSDIIPEKYSYKIINTFPHDLNAYIQGLYWDDGYIYEGTGKPGASSLRKYKIENYEILQSINLPDDLFGEGICLLNNKIYQLTWRSRKGFVYNKDDFKLIQEFNYFTEGWGLATNGEHLIMSDGSNSIYFVNPEYFTEEKRIEVFDNNGPVNSLNELEWIENKLYANIYGKDIIVIIEPETGKVTGEINLETIRPIGTPKDMEHVLNGIAYNNKPNHLIVTGKYWPKMFEIEVIKE